MILQNLAHIGDIFAIPLFIYGIIYFSQIKNKKIGEWILLVFNIIGLIADIIFTIIFVWSNLR